ncbi:ABC-type Fe3+-hydroxamate transporter, periplasmic component [Thiohalobacter thiocyanaticus]|uniref:ABC-type Fe3+-hydroxamate transporter, periplasmic component n=1 Tax=Thiohalobacter thiocyanaticus TaxID=585455 RepID=A0A1Z4VUT6_9GAMM|nr:cobalamin-binding protein [Thiohalobacter thiocyanaticus]BAZ95138.1 ABC-type Fe3+-hydroxamate transporter, periplasmic component [Thiohalobacter thiocyanaticus]
MSLWLVLAFPAACVAAGVRVEDMSGQALVLDAPAQRIVSLAPSLTELAYAAGAGERLVGAVAYSDYPAPARRLPAVGNANRIDLEAVLALQPDVVLAWGSGNPPAQLARFRQLGIPVFIAEPHSLDDIALLLERIGVLAGTRARADQAAREFRARRDALRARYSDRPVVRVFYEVWHRPLMTVNGDHTISAVIRLCGGRNLFADLPQLSGQVALEAVLAADPDAIVAGGMDATRPEWLDHWQRWPRLRAVRNAHIFHIPPDLIHRHSPRILDGAERMCELLEQVRQSQ